MHVSQPERDREIILTEPRRIEKTNVRKKSRNGDQVSQALLFGNMRDRREV